ncbi:MAG: hypothetical protein ACAI35_27150 [Candidatus Methylacidiphilales bacterium]|nr:hypothetical protein [Candidatus Methylacidiphilales bacterium]
MSASKKPDSQWEDPEEDDSHPDPYVEEQSWAALTDRLLYNIGWLITGAFVLYTGMLYLGITSESAFRFTFRIALSAGVLRFLLLSIYR